MKKSNTCFIFFVFYAKEEKIYDKKNIILKVVTLLSHNSVFFLSKRTL